MLFRSSHAVSSSLYSLQLVPFISSGVSSPCRNELIALPRPRLVETSCTVPEHFLFLSFRRMQRTEALHPEHLQFIVDVLMKERLAVQAARHK